MREKTLEILDRSGNQRFGCFSPFRERLRFSKEKSMEVGSVQAEGEVYINGLAVNQEAAEEEDRNQGGELTDYFSEMHPEKVEEGRREERESTWRP